MNEGYHSQQVHERRQSQFALVLFLPDDLDKIVTPLRERFDPMYNLVPPHVTIVFPFEYGRPLDELAGLLRAELENEGEILIEMDSIVDFYPSYPVICWSIKPNDKLTNLHYRLYGRLDMAVPHREYRPHITVAREISEHRRVLVKEQIAPYLPKERFVASTADLIMPLHGSKWVSVRTFSFEA